MKKILVVCLDEIKDKFSTKFDTKIYDVQYTDGDEKEDYELYDYIFDANFDNDTENYLKYCRINRAKIFLNTVKTSIAEQNYIFEKPKIKSHIFGINLQESFILDNVWEVTSPRRYDIQVLIDTMSELNHKYIIVEDRVGMFRPKVNYLIINEIFTLVNNNTITENFAKSLYQEMVSKFNVTEVFETLMAIYEDTQDLKYFPNPLLKSKYLYNHSFFRAE